MLDFVVGHLAMIEFTHILEMGINLLSDAEIAGQFYSGK
jgi:hypothetical protein